MRCETGDMRFETVTEDRRRKTEDGSRKADFGEKWKNCQVIFRTGQKIKLRS
jgi:hypothetical protein